MLSRFLLFILSSLFTLSFILFIAISFTDQPASYFLPQYRAFTFLAGSILYVISLRSKTIFPSYSNIYSSISLILIFLLCFLPFDFGHGYLTHIIITPLVLIVCASSSSTQYSFSGRLLSYPLLSFIGLISYSLYLWHWPIIVFGRLMYGTILSHVLVQLLLIILLSLFSYIFIETRFSKFLDSYRFKPSLLAVFVSSICLSLYTISIQKFSKLLYLDKGNVLKDTTPNPYLFFPLALTIHKF